MVTRLVLLVVGGYLLGSLPLTYLVAKLSRGIDLRRYGSGSVGATNLTRATSKWAGMSAGAFDFGKGMLMVWAAQAVGLGIGAQVAVGMAVIIGHNWSVFLRFSGGRGILTTLGVALILPLVHGLTPWGVIAGLSIVAVCLLVLRNLPLGVAGGVASLPLVSWGVGEPLSLNLGFLAMFLVVVIKRLAVPRAAIAASLSTREVLFNRLLFDRDIRDREAWIHRTPQEASSSGGQRGQKRGSPQ